MNVVALFAAVLGVATAIAGIAMTILAFESVPYFDSIEFFRQFLDAGGWGGYGFTELYAHHNEHRLVLPRLWLLIDLGLFGGTQGFLVAVIVVSCVAHAVVLIWVFRSLGHAGPVSWVFAAVALGAVLSPVQWESLIWGFQVAFVQVWLFATLAFAVIACSTYQPGRRIALAAVFALAATYSLANGILVWPLLVALALWVGVRGWAFWQLAALALVIVGVEAVGYQPHPGHGDPLQEVRHPVILVRYALRFLTSGVSGVDGSVREALGAVLVLFVLAVAADALVRRHRYRPGHAALLAAAGFVIGGALLTAMGRAIFGLEQANAGRYATPSLIFLLVVFALLLDRISSVGNRHRLVGAVLTVVSAAGLLLPGAVRGVRQLPEVLAGRDARMNAVTAYLAGGYRPDTLAPIYPFQPTIPYIMLRRLEQQGWGPFAERDRFMPPPALLAGLPVLPSQTCRGHVDSAVSDPVAGVVVTGWAADARSTEQPSWILVTDVGGNVVGWGASRMRRDDVGEALGIGWRGRGFMAVGPDPASAPLVVVAAFEDGRLCVLDADVTPPPRFLATLPATARPAADGAWTVVEGSGTDRTGPQPVPAAVEPAIGTLGENSRLVARIDLAPPGVRAALAVPVLTGPYPTATVLLVRDAETDEEVERHVFERPSQDGWVWRVFARSADPRFKGHILRVEATTAGPRPEVGMAVGRPHWIPVAEGGTGAGMSLHLDGPARDGDR